MPILNHNIICIISNLEAQSVVRSSIQNSGLTLFWRMASTPGPFLLALSFSCLPWHFLRLWHFCCCSRMAGDKMSTKKCGLAEAAAVTASLS